jgi:hypothetical protein
MTDGNSLDETTVGPALNGNPAPMDPQAAAELAQELALVAQALFAQLLPDTSARAVAGVPAPTGSAPAAVAPLAPVDTMNHSIPVVASSVSEPEAAQLPDSVPMTSPAVTEPVAVPLPTLAQTPAPAKAQPLQSVPMPQVQVASVPVPQLVQSAPAEEPDVTVSAASKADQHSMAMLEEIKFLDE